MLAFGASPTGLIGGTSTRGTVSLVMLAPPGGGAVTLTSTNPAVVQVPPTVSIAAGNSANSFTITSSSVSLGTTVEVDATAGGVTKSVFINVAPDPNAPPLLSAVTLASPTVVGGNSVSGTVLLSGPAPAGGASVTLSTSNLVARPQPVVNVPAGATSAGFTVTTSTVTANTPVTITAILGNTSKSVGLTVTPRGGPATWAGHPEPRQPGGSGERRAADPVRLERRRECGHVPDPDLLLEQLHHPHHEPDGERVAGDDRWPTGAAALLARTGHQLRGCGRARSRPRAASRRKARRLRLPWRACPL